MVCESRPNYSLVDEVIPNPMPVEWDYIFISPREI